MNEHYKLVKPSMPSLIPTAMILVTYFTHIPMVMVGEMEEWQDSV